MRVNSLPLPPPLLLLLLLLLVFKISGAATKAKACEEMYLRNTFA
jgi:hypothetical protein